MDMSETHWFRSHWKLILNLVTIAALIIMIFALREQLGETFRNLARVHAWALLLMIPIEIINYHSQARLYQRLFGIVGNKLSYKHLYRVSLELNFVNSVFPSGGVTGISYFSLRLRDGKDLSGSKATLVHFVKLGLTFLSFELMIIIGLISLSVMGRVNNLTVMFAAILSTLLVVGTIGFIYIVGSQHRINVFFTAVTKVLNRIIHVVRPKHPETINISRARETFNDVHHNYQAIQGKYEELRAPFWYAFIANVTEILAIYVVYIAFGEFVNIGAVIMAYAVANFAGLISILPGGIGVYEALMAAVMATAGVPASVSLPVIIMYRVVNTAIQLPPGYYFYHKNLSSPDQQLNMTNDS